MPDTVAVNLIDRLPKNEDMGYAIYLVGRNMAKIFEYKKYYDSILTNSFSQVCETLGIDIPKKDS